MAPGGAVALKSPASPSNEVVRVARRVHAHARARVCARARASAPPSELAHRCS